MLPLQTATITVEGSMAIMEKAPLECLSECLAFDDPIKWRNKAFKEGRWDGRTRLNREYVFAAGFVPRVISYLQSQGYGVSMQGDAYDVADTQDFDPNIHKDVLQDIIL